MKLRNPAHAADVLAYIEQTRAKALEGQEMELLLVDVSHLFHMNYHATADKPINEAYKRTLEQVAGLTQDVPHVAICVDSPPYLRKQIAPSYKAQRDALEPAVVDMFARIKERLAKDGFPIWGAKGYEADDIIAGAVAWARNRNPPLTVTIASADKDMLQLVAEGVTVLSTKTGARMGSAEVEAKFGVPPAQLRDLLAIMGDTADNVPGAKGVGLKRGAELLSQYGNIDAIYEAYRVLLDVEPEAKLKAFERSMLDCREQVMLARKLVTLVTDAPVDYEEALKQRMTQPIAEPTADWTDAEFESEPDASEMAALAGDALDAMADDIVAEFDKATGKTEEPVSETKQVKVEAVEEPKVRAKPITEIVRSPVSYALELEPRSLGQVDTLATAMFNSRLFGKFPNKEAVMAAVLRGREIGLSALMALDCFYVVGNRIVMSAHLIAARGQADPNCEYMQVIESTAESCTVEIKNRRNPKATRYTYTLDQAKQAGLCPENPRTRPPPQGKDDRVPWEKDPQAMLAKTVKVRAVRQEFPGAALGLYAPEELGGETEAA